MRVEIHERVLHFFESRNDSPPILLLGDFGLRLGRLHLRCDGRIQYGDVYGRQKAEREGFEQSRKRETGSPTACRQTDGGQLRKLCLSDQVVRLQDSVLRSNKVG